MNDEEIDKIWYDLYHMDHYMLPFSSGECMLYHHKYSGYYTPGGGIYPYFEIILARKFRIELHYENNLIKLNLYRPPEDENRWKYIEIPQKVNLEDYLEIKEYRGAKVPLSVKRFETEYMVERLRNLIAFS